MSDSGAGEKGKFDNPFFNLSKPYLDFIGKGKIYNLVYIVMAAISLLLPFAAIFVVVNSGILKYGGAKFIVAFIFAWLIIAFACWIGFQLWWNRRTQVSSVSESEFVATPIFSDIFQTFGEWIGTLIGIIGAGVGLIATIALGSDASYLFSVIGLGFLPSGALSIIAAPIAGFFIIILSRFLAEQLRIFAAIANNTKEIATNIKK